MNLRSLEYFLAVTEEMSFTRAAERLFLTQQALSSHIKRLEDEYDAVLFHRKPVLSLTQKGEELKYWAEQILSAEKNLRANLYDIGTNCRGRIRVGIARLRAFRMMPEIMERYRLLYPNVAIEVVDGATDFFRDQLQNNKLDMYIGVNVETGMNDVAVPLVSEAVWCFSTHSLLQQYFAGDGEDLTVWLAGEPDIRALPALPLLVTQSSNRIRRQLDKYFYAGGARPNVYFESSSQHLLCLLAEKDMGLAVVSPMILHTKWATISRSPNLCAFPLCRELPENMLSLVYRRDDPMPKYAGDFIRVVREAFTAYGRLLSFEAQFRKELSAEKSLSRPGIES